ncbi:hypothetical protein KGF54_002833 [Candida jiufengensis]|uniref:uncharacterized protein n=1 Tax=Candida jiufengensis TaxID=497108 RepID=UPI002224EBC1|nr:uncharacterized protein KGF54_002833 [Candida jiufengensis]KAI5953461.1 hypothetical protein KGF54_002833 [Candida jiufengensis]
MPYTIGDRKIKLTPSITKSDLKLLLKHSKMIKFYLNNSILKFLINLKKIIHLYSDIFIIYSTLIRKIQNFEDITKMTNLCSRNLLVLEIDFNEIFGKKIMNDEDLTRNNNGNNNNNLGNHISNNDNLMDDSIHSLLNPSSNSINSSLSSHSSTSSRLNNFKLKNFEDQNYENIIKPSTKLILKTSLSIFDQINKNLLCIELFFSSFSNLKKLLVPFLKEQTQSLIVNLKTIENLLTKNLFVDNIPSVQELEYIDNSDSNMENHKTDNLFIRDQDSFESLNLLNNLIEIEKVTSGFEKESLKLKTAFFTFNTSLVQYTSLLLGKAILKRNIDQQQCEIIKRREICYQASEHVVSIPLTEDNKNFLGNDNQNYNHNANNANQNQNSMKSFSKILTYILMILMLLIVLVGYRLVKLIFGI